MPKLFPWKKGKKKEKKSIRDALTPCSAFVAVPSTPPPGSATSNQSNPFNFSASPSSLSVTPIHQVLETSRRGNHGQSTPSNSQKGPTRRQVGGSHGEGVGLYSLAGAADDFPDDVEEPGYDVVHTSFNRPRFPSPQHTSTTLPPSHPTSSTPITKHTASQRSKSRNAPSVHSNHPPKSPLSTVLSASDLPSVTSALSVHSDSSDIDYRLSLSPTTNKQSPSLRVAKPDQDPRLVSSVKKQPVVKTTEEREALYSRVNKPKKKSSEKKRKEKDSSRRSKEEHISSMNYSPEPIHSIHKESVDASTHSKQVRKKLFSDQPLSKHKRHSTEDTARSNPSSSSRHRMHMKETVDYDSKHTRRNVDYIEQDYLPSSEESSTSLDNYFRYDEETSPDVQKQQMSRSMDLPNHRPPVSPHSRSSRDRHRRRKSAGAILDHSECRAATTAFAHQPGSYVDAPVLQPSFVQRQGDVYVFSEQLPDGRIQYYSATPVGTQATHPHSHTPPLVDRPRSHTPTSQTPPVIRNSRSETPTAQASPLSRPHSHTPTPHTPPLINLPPSPPTHQGFPTRHEGANQVDGNPAVSKTTTSSTEFGHFPHSPPPPGGYTQTTPYQQRAESVIISTVRPEGGAASSTLITPLGLHSTPGPTQEYCGDESKTSPQVRLLESSLQRAAGVEMTSSQRGATGTPASPLLTQRRSPLIADNDRVPLNSQMDLIAQYERREAEFKAHNKKSEALNRELGRENTSMKKSYEDLLAQSNGSSEQLQSRLSSLISENSSLKAVRLDNEAKLRLLESNVTKLKGEVDTLSHENKALLARQQASLEEKGEWERVAAHAHSVMDENTSLLKSQETHRKTIEHLKQKHQTIVSRLNKEIGKLHKERRATEGSLGSLRQSHTELLRKFDELSERAAGQVPLEEHQSVLKEMQRLVEKLDEENDIDLKSREAQMKISDKDKRYLVTKLTDAKAIIYQLEGEVAQLHKAHTRTHEKLMDSKRELELARDREVILHSQLSKAVLCAEKAASEREAFAKIAKSQEQAKERALIHGVKKEVSMEKRLESHRYRQMEKASAILHEQDEDHRQQRDQYKREISQLKSLLAKKQTYVDQLIRDSQYQ